MQAALPCVGAAVSRCSALNFHGYLAKSEQKEDSGTTPIDQLCALSSLLVFLFMWLYMIVFALPLISRTLLFTCTKRIQKAI
jgi:hypothetical protein